MEIEEVEIEKKLKPWEVKEIKEETPENIREELEQLKKENELIKKEKSTWRDQIRNFKSDSEKQKMRMIYNKSDLEKKLKNAKNTGVVDTSSNKKEEEEDKKKMQEIEKVFTEKIKLLHNKLKDLNTKYDKLEEKHNHDTLQNKKLLAKMEAPKKTPPPLPSNVKATTNSSSPSNVRKKPTGVTQVKKREEKGSSKKNKNDDNDQGLFFETGALNTEEIGELQVQIEKILKNQPAELEDVQRFKKFLTFDEGRRVFTYILKNATKKNDSICLNENSFDLMLLLVHTTLSNMDLSESVNFITASVLLKGIFINFYFFLFSLIFIYFYFLFIFIFYLFLLL